MSRCQDILGGFPLPPSYLISSDARELTKATDEISKAISTFQEVYMEIGMKAGARLLYQLMVEDEKKDVY
jgi:hypothetical protein